ncbi:MAG TPA: hypothetical protein PK442_10885 [Synergistales bacterium]|nr:hypothetical protein [Synergistaceae bacterium]HOO88200.1 hypothetical protein [Synergistales bacterium]
MPMNHRTIQRCCIVAGVGLLLWTSVEFFLLAFLTTRFMEGAGILLWLQGYLMALRSSPVGIAGALLVLFAFFMRRM